MQYIKKRNNQYKYSKEIINKIYNKIRSNNKTFNDNYLLIGSGELKTGTIDKTNEILNEYSDLNIEIDMLDSTDQEVRIVIFNLNKSFTCAGLVLDYENKIAEIIDLRSDSSCIKTNEKVLPKILQVLIGICKSANMTKINMSVMSYHRCKDPNYTIKLDIGNMLTDGKPYYYKYHFKYVNETNHKIVKINRHVLKTMLTKDIKWTGLEKTIKKNVKDTSLNDNINDIIVKIKNIYDESLNENIKDFLKIIKYQFCEIFSVIYSELYIKVGLRTLLSDHMMTYLL